MKKIDSIDVIHSILLDIAKAFHLVCTNNRIPYYMLGGTMLGAIRHKGFIPWDDDMDFGVPREYYKKCINLLEKELPFYYKVETAYKNDKIIGDFIKIQDTRTLIKEDKYKSNTKNHIGVNIDVFPLDETNNKKGPFSRNRIIQFLSSIDGYRLFSLKNRPFPKKIIALFIKIVLFPFGKHSILKITKKLASSGKGAFLANHYGAWKMKEIISKSIMGTPQLYLFEDMEYFGVEKYDSYLVHLYNNWKELPPLEKRKVHITDSYELGISE